TLTRVSYSGNVYCVSVPSGFIAVRRNGCAVITGQCQQIPRKVEWKKSGDPVKDEALKDRPGLRECFVAKPGHKFLIYDYSAQELRVAASITLEKTMLSAFAEGKELHTYSATLMY